LLLLVSQAILKLFALSSQTVLKSLLSPLQARFKAALNPLYTPADRTSIIHYSSFTSTPARRVAGSLPACQERQACLPLKAGSIPACRQAGSIFLRAFLCFVKKTFTLAQHFKGSGCLF
jgi:hypothetical protein